MRTALLLIAGVLLATPAAARAEPDPTVATVLATAGTVIPLGGLGVATFGRNRAWRPILVTSYVALLVAPSAGHFYAGEYVTTGLGIRMIGGAAVGLGFTAMSCGRRNPLYCIPPGLLPVFLGTVTMLVGAGWDIASADDAAESASTQPRMFSIGGSF